MPPKTAKPNPHGRVFNFAAGPAVLPVEVLETAQRDTLNWQGCGISVMEMSHRSKEFTSIIENAEADLRRLLDIPSNYKVRYFPLSRIKQTLPHLLCIPSTQTSSTLRAGRAQTMFYCELLRI